ncbi:hypothetical protein AVEN_270143-1 [Araneus ventricosus]|uniref:Uncharacterized protein n=1 Tax=Araneus ventricosus TaxID=182803 RepID=A0A4Y2PEV2_ARAVE|nr:hypothetical protein AVEN_270143-1 [Araneus ventricosus]
MLVNQILAMYGGCPVLNCTKHPNTKNDDIHSEVDTSSCMEMDTTPAVNKQEQAATPLGNGKADEDDFQMVSPRKAARTNSNKNRKCVCQTGRRKYT